MGRQFSDSLRRRIVDLYNTKIGVTAVQKQLEQEGHKVGRSAIYRLVSKWKTHNTIATLPCKSRKPLHVTTTLLDFIDNEMKANDELTANKLRLYLLKCGIT